MKIKKDELIKQLRDIGYEGNVLCGEMTIGEHKKDFLEITIPKKGNTNVINKLYSIGWSKIWEGKLSDSMKYVGYSMCINLRRYY